MGSSIRKRIVAFVNVFLALSVVIIPLELQTTKALAAATGTTPMYAYTSANSGRYSFKITASDNPTTITNIGDMGIQCGNMNLANHAGTKVYQSYNCNGSNKKFTEIDVATDTFASYVVSERTHTMAISPDDRYMYFADPYYTFKWDLSTTPPTYVLSGSRDDNNAGLNLGILPNGQKLYSASVQRSKVQVFDTNLALIATVTDPAFNTLRWTVTNPSGTEVWVGFGSTYKIIDTSTDTISRTINATFGTSALPSFSADGNYLYTTSGAGVEKVDTATGLSVHTYTGTGLANGTHASISPDGRYVYVANGTTVGWVNLSSGLTGAITLPTTTPTDSTKTIAWAMPLAAPSISISSNSFNVETNSPLGSSYTISNSGGAVASYSLAPSLPAGLSFDTTTGLLSGTPTAASPSTTYTITATNVTGNSTATFSLQVSDPAPTPLPTISESVAGVFTPQPIASATEKKSNWIAKPLVTQSQPYATPTQTSSTKVAPTLGAHNDVANKQNHSLPITLAIISLGVVATLIVFKLGLHLFKLNR